MGQSSSTAAARRQAEVDTFTEVLPLVMTYEGLESDPKAICNILATSRALQNALHSVWPGQLQVHMHSHDSHDRAQCFAKWLRHHGKILRGVTVSLPSTQLQLTTWQKLWRATSDYMADALAAAAGASPKGLHLQSVFVANPTQSILDQLNAVHLTKLELSYADKQALGSLNDVRTTVAALTNLKHLNFEWSECCHSTGKWRGYWRGSIDEFVPATAQLKQLTTLKLCEVSDPSVLSLLPAQLIELHVKINYNRDYDYKTHGSSVQLGHLTALTSLQYKHKEHSSDRGDSCHLKICSGMKLPQNLRELRIDDVLDIQPLLQLTQLQLLSISNPNLNAEQLQQLGTGLRAESAHGAVSDSQGCSCGLQEVHLYYEGWSAHSPTDAAAAGWRALPVKHLKLYEQYADTMAVCMPALSGLTGLTNLRFVGGELRPFLHLLPGVLKTLPQLRELRIDPDDLYILETPDYADQFLEAALEMQDIATAVAKLKHLHSLYISSCMTDTAVLTLRPLMQLTHLALFECCHISNSAVLSLASSLTGLQELNLNWCLQVDDEWLVSFSSLSSLNCLKVEETSTTDEGVQMLQTQQPGLVVIGGKA